MRLNRPNRWTEKTHEGATAARMTPLQALRRSVCSCFLWEKEFYEDGQDIAKRIGDLVSQCDPVDVAALCVESRSSHHLRHVPLLLLCHLAKTSKGTSLMRETVPKVVRRADELTELPALWWHLNPDTHIPHNMEKGLRACWPNFSEYQFAKYDRDGAVKLRDVMRLTHPKPVMRRKKVENPLGEDISGGGDIYVDDDSHSQLYKRIIDRTLTTPDTWEVELSAGKDKRETFERLIREGKLGYFALLRNLRNMEQAGCDRELVMDAIRARKGGAERILPFRYVAAARAAPTYERALDQALLHAIADQESFDKTTAILVDVSGSMDAKLSARSDLTRMDAAATLASIVRGDVRVFTFSNQCIEVAPRLGMAGVETVKNSQGHGGTWLGKALQVMNIQVRPHRLIVITDEQSHDSVSDPTMPHAYMINVASNKNGVGYGKWVHIDGFSENVLRFIHEYEKQACLSG